MSSYPPGGDYDERLLDSAPKATKAERQVRTFSLLALIRADPNARPPAERSASRKDIMSTCWRAIIATRR